MIYSHNANSVRALGTENFGPARLSLRLLLARQLGQLDQLGQSGRSQLSQASLLAQLSSPSPKMLRNLFAHIGRKPRLSLWSKSVWILSALLVFSGVANAQGLQALMEKARQYDAVYLAARANARAAQARADQGDAALMPSVNFSASAYRSQQSTEFPDTPTVSSPDRAYTTQNLGITAVQPLYRPSNLASFSQSQQQELIARAQVTQAEYDLMVRLAVAYFDVLTAQENLLSVQAQKNAVGEQLAFANSSFAVGATTITDSKDAQARFDLASAAEIQAGNDLEVKKSVLENFVGATSSTRPTLQLLKLKEAADFTRLKKYSLEEWLQNLDVSPSIQIAKANGAIAQLESSKVLAGHKPTLDATASYSRINNDGGSSGSGTSSKVGVGQVGIVFTLPIFSGFNTQNKLREARALEEKAANDLEAAQRTARVQTRTSYLAVQAGAASIEAYSAALASTQSALEANQVGLKIGVRINMDVLNTQSQLYQTRRDWVRVRHEFLASYLRLLQASGKLTAADFASIDQLLEP